MNRAKLIYSAQNIEYKLKEQILRDISLDEELIKEITTDIKKLEIFSAKNADLILAVSEEDKLFLEKNSSKDVIYAHNASYKRVAMSDKVAFWKKKIAWEVFCFCG